VDTGDDDTHVYFRPTKAKKRLFRKPDTPPSANTLIIGEDVWKVKEMMWWLNGGTTDEKYFAIRSTCGSRKCLHPQHLGLHIPPAKKVKPKKEPPQPKQKKVEKPVEAEPAEPVDPVWEAKQKAKEERAKKFAMLSGDRTKCISAKVWFPTKTKIDKAVRVYNNELRQPGQSRLHAYDCPWCDGYHFTSKNPKKSKNTKVKGSWS